ncbi:unnamed protein product [Mytilus edulis]|uniref:Integrase zinc-binding domain-containing protein n=1 Tax=Mytilus edulis TaxID=6550 RepID=A0A8S3TN67_MYTED|nr:unnamed protein product [Mytilus edulis]
MSRNPCKSCKHQEDLNQAENDNDKEKSEKPVECHSNLEKQEETVKHLATPLTEADETPDITEITGLIPGNIRAVTRSELKEQQNEMKVNEALLGKPPWESISSGTSALKTLWGQWDRLEMHGGVLYRRFETNIGQTARNKMIVPKSRTQELLHYFHDVPSAAHLGVDKTLEKLKNGFYWPNMKEYVQAYCRSCDSCFARKPKKESTKAPLGTYVSGEPMERVMMAYRSSVHASTSKTPNSMLFGREVTLPLQAVIPQPDTEIQENRSPDDYVAHLQNKLKENHAFARKALKKVSIYQKKRYDLNAKKRIFKRGEAVWIYDPIRKKGVCSKLTPKWKGPFIIEKRIDDVTYRVKRSLRQPSTVYHVDRLALYQGRNVPSWASRFRRMMNLEEANNDQQLDKPVG